VRTVIAISAFVAGLIVCYFLFSVGVVQKMTGVPNISNDQNLSVYLSFISVMLTAVTTILTAMAIGIGVVAAYTFAGLKTQAEAISVDTAEKVAKATAERVANDTADKVAKERLSVANLKDIITKVVAVNETESQSAAEWGKPQDEEER
jgi:hypothetical protein